jgi:elongation factor G
MRFVIMFVLRQSLVLVNFKEIFSKMASVSDIRNVVLAGHGGCGKTSLAEAIIYNSGATSRLGRVEEGNTVMDYLEDEIARKISVSSAFYPVSHNGMTINLIDTPGFPDFINDARAAFRGADIAVIVISAVDGIEVMTDKVNQFAEKGNLARAIFINKINRERADFDKVLAEIKKTFHGAMALTIPIGKEDKFKGVIDLLNLKAIYPEGDGKKVRIEDVPADMMDAVKTLRTETIEKIAENNEAMMEKYVMEEEIPIEEFYSVLKDAIRSGEIIPVFTGSATTNNGVTALTDAIVNIFPSPAEFPPAVGVKPGTEEKEEREPDPNAPISAFVIKTMIDPFAGRINIVRVLSGKITSDSNLFNTSRQEKEKIGPLLKLKGKDNMSVSELIAGDIGVLVKLTVTNTGETICRADNPILYKPIDFPQPIYALALTPKSREDEQRLTQGLTKLTEEEPTLIWDRNIETHELILRGMGPNHLAVALDKLKRRFNVSVDTKIPEIAYRETIKKKSEAQGKHKKQSGGAGQYGDVHIRYEPLERGSGFEFVDAIVGGAVPNQYIPAVEKGLRENIADGPLAGYPTTDFRATLFFGSYHKVDSKEVAFKSAARLSFRKGWMDASPILLEPVYSVRIMIPEEFMGDIMGDLNSKRARIKDMQSQGRMQIIIADIPLAELQNYVADLNSITSGRGTFEMEFIRYDEVPNDAAKKIIERRQAGKTEDEE